jgi:hypothetical protein
MKGDAPDHHELRRHDRDAQPEHDLSDDAVRPRHEQSQENDREPGNEKPSASGEPADEYTHTERLAEMSSIDQGYISRISPLVFWRVRHPVGFQVRPE